MNRFPDPGKWTYQFDYLERGSDGCVIFDYDGEFVFLLKITQFEDMNDLIRMIAFLEGMSCRNCLFVARDELIDRNLV